MYNKKTRHDYLFYRMATQNYLNFCVKEVINDLKYGNIQEVGKNLEKKIKEEKLSPEDVEELLKSEEFNGFFSNHFQMRMYGIQTIVNCAFCLESLINDYGSEKLGARYYKDHLDRLNVKSKWLIIPRLVTGHTIDKGGEGYESLTRLVDIRNKLAHSKGKKIVADKLQESEAFKKIVDYLSEVEGCYKGVEVLLNEFREIDPDYEPLTTYEKRDRKGSDFGRLYHTMLYHENLIKFEF